MGQTHAVAVSGTRSRSIRNIIFMKPGKRFIFFLDGRQNGAARSRRPRKPTLPAENGDNTVRGMAVPDCGTAGPPETAFKGTNGFRLYPIRIVVNQHVCAVRQGQWTLRGVTERDAGDSKNGCLLLNPPESVRTTAAEAMRLRNSRYPSGGKTWMPESPPS